MKQQEVDRMISEASSRGLTLTFIQLADLGIGGRFRLKWARYGVWEQAGERLRDMETRRRDGFCEASDRGLIEARINYYRACLSYESCKVTELQFELVKQLVAPVRPPILTMIFWVALISFAAWIFLGETTGKIVAILGAYLPFSMLASMRFEQRSEAQSIAVELDVATRTRDGGEKWYRDQIAELSRQNKQLLDCA
jgi:hypothetical protein